MSIRVAKYNYIKKYAPKTPGYENIIIHTTGELSPYVMKDKDGVIMENYWQFSKIWASVDNIKQPLSKWQNDIIRWEHPAEVHYVDGQIKDEYWAWRKKGFKNARWVKYPNGYGNRKKMLASIYGDKDNYEILGYIEARKQIYYAKYKEIATGTKLFKKLKGQLKIGNHIQICEVDGPTYVKDIYPYSTVKNGSIAANKETLTALMNRPEQPFGHGYSLAAALLDIEFE